MKTKKMEAKTILMALLLCVASLFSVTACNNGDLRINVPVEALEGYVGLYKAPNFEVVNAAGEYMSGYSVQLKSVKDPDNQAVEVSDGRINAEKVGVYRFTYKAKGAKDAVLSVNFVYSPPTVDLPLDGLPGYYMRGIWYAVPQFRFSNADMTASKVKLLHESADGQSNEIPTIGGFKAPYSTGNYKWVVDAVSPEGATKSFEYNVSAIGPSEVIPDKVAYFDEEFGMKQLGFRSPGELELSYNTDAQYAREDEQGSLKVQVAKLGSGTDAGRLILQIPYVADVSKYESISFWVYNPNDFKIKSGYCWGTGAEDILCEANAWTQITWSIASIFAKPGKTHATYPSIANFQIRFVGADGSALPVGSEYYLSAMYCVGEKDPTAGPSEVVPDKILYFDEEFGIQQLGFYVAGELALSHNTDAQYAREDEQGSLKVQVAKLGSGTDAGRLILKAPYVADVSKYESISFWVYNPNDFKIKTGYCWGTGAEDILCEANAWTQITWSIASIFAKPGKTHATYPSIANFQIRFVGADGSALPVGSEYYLSAMYCVE